MLHDDDALQALCGAEEDADVQAAKSAKAEQNAELAEFDENIPWDEREAERKREEEEVSKVEMELAQLDKEVSRYSNSPHACCTVGSCWKFGSLSIIRDRKPSERISFIE